MIDLLSPWELDSFDLLHFDAMIIEKLGDFILQEVLRWCAAHVDDTVGHGENLRASLTIQGASCLRSASTVALMAAGECLVGAQGGFVGWHHDHEMTT